MMDSEGVINVGSVMVQTTQGRGFTPEEIAERALARILYLSTEAPEPIRMQAEAYKDQLRYILTFYMHEAIRSHHVTLVNKFTKAGHPELIPILDL